MNNENSDLFIFDPNKSDEVLALRLYLIIRKAHHAKASFLKQALGCSSKELYAALKWLIDTGKLELVPPPIIDPLNENFSRN